MNLRQSLFALALLLSPTLAFAHAGHDHSGLLSGLAHPLLGLDHLLAMLAVGLWAAQQSGAARWAVPLGFVGSMLLGGLFGFGGVQLPLLETAIASSLLALGLLVAVAARLPLAIALGLTGLFGLSHGLAHGLELPAQASPWAYAGGFVIATAALHAAGYALVHGLPQAAAPLVRLAGAASALSGACLLAG
ncbi:urease accessory protein [Pseudomonas benzenivorans]|nr:HupE/UreJ family protein [Pseudomonas benzenivorans]SDI09923.1 urease accessory protein [Pseudomonas benzenivorans]